MYMYVWIPCKIPQLIPRPACGGSFISPCLPPRLYASMPRRNAVYCIQFCSSDQFETVDKWLIAATPHTPWLSMSDLHEVVIVTIFWLIAVIWIAPTLTFTYHFSDRFANPHQCRDGVMAATRPSSWQLPPLPNQTALISICRQSARWNWFKSDMKSYC